MNTSEGFTGKLIDTPRLHRQWMLAGNPALFIDRLIREHGDFVRCRGVIDFHLINNPHLVREVMKNTMRDYDKNSLIYNHFRNVFGKGLVTAEGEAWKRKRKLMQPMFSRLELDKSFVTPGGFFRVHYDTSGINTPGYDLNLLAQALDSTYKFEITELGYTVPPSDGEFTSDIGCCPDTPLLSAPGSCSG